MPFQYSRDDTTRQVRIIVTDPFTMAEFIESAEYQLADGAWQYGLLVDARAMVEPPSPADIRLFLARIQELVAGNGPRGPIAFVAKNSGVIGRAQMYSALGGRTELLEVFWDVTDAQTWLDQRRRFREPNSR
jgi:hypothetical protein